MKPYPAKLGSHEAGSLAAANFRNKKHAVKMPRRPQKTGGPLRDAAAT